jgi:phosphoribosylglycinamide formyltransferase-1
MSPGPERIDLVVLISGRGSNMLSIVERAQDPASNYRVRAVISNRADATGLETARNRGIAGDCVEHRWYRDRESFDAALSGRIDGYQPDLIALAGFMRILSPTFVAHYQGRILNIHPSLLPKYRGLETHARVLRAGEHEHGASVHFVTAELDGGPVILQARVPVMGDDDEQTLAARVLEQEHQIYPLAITWFATGRLRVRDGVASMDGRALVKPMTLSELNR